MSRKPRVFISRTTAGLADLAEQIARLLRERGFDPIIQTDFYPSTHDVKGMLADHLHQCDAVICLIGPAYGSGPRDPITKAEQPVRGLKDPRTKDSLFSYTQLELLIARDLGRPTYTFFIQGDELPTVFAPEPPELVQRQQTFIAEFAKDGRNTYGTFSQWDLPNDPARGLKQAIEAIKFEITVLAGKPTNLPYTSLGTLFKGRDEFLVEIRQHLTSEGPVVIKGKRAIHGMGGVGKTRAAIEYAWKHAHEYEALLFISADTPEALHRNLAALCGPLVFNLPEQNEDEQELQIDAVFRRLELQPGWLLIIDNVDTHEAAVETKALLAKLTTGHVLITSRISDWTGHVKSLDLDVLCEAASISFLDERTEERRPKKKDDPEKAAALVKLLDCLALALEQAGAHISTASISYADYIGLWESHRADVLRWHDEKKMKYPRSLAITYETSISQLSDGAKELFQTLSWFAADPVPRSLLDSRPAPAKEKRHLIEIERLHLARYASDGKVFVIHRLNQEITRQQQSSPRPPALIAALDWIREGFPVDVDDVRTWPVANDLLAHVISIARFGADQNIAIPSAELFNQAAVLLDTRAEYAPAEKLYKDAIKLAESAGEVVDEFYTTYLMNLAELHSNLSRFDEAEPLMRRVLAMDERQFGTEHPEVAKDLCNLGVLLMSMNRLEEAETLFRRALAIDESWYGMDHPDVARDSSNLANIFADTQRIDEAETLFRRSLVISEANYGSNHPEIAKDLINLANILTSTQRMAEAEPMIRRALAIDKENLGDEHPDVARDISTLASLLASTGRLEEAEALFRRSLAISEASFGGDHPEVAKDLANLAGLLMTTNRLGEAEPLFRRSLAISEVSFGDDHPEVAKDLANLASLLVTTNCLAEAEPLFRRTLAIDEANFESDHPEVATDLSNLADLLGSTNRLSEAETMYRRALAISEKSFGSDTPQVATDLSNLASILVAAKRFSEAEPLLRRALSIDESSFGNDNPEVAIDLVNLADLLNWSGRPDEGEPLARRALAISERNFGSDDPEIVKDLIVVAESLMNSERHPLAEPLIMQALSISEKHYGFHHMENGVVLDALAQCYSATERVPEAKKIMEQRLAALLRFTADTGYEHTDLSEVKKSYRTLLVQQGDSEAKARKKVSKLINALRSQCEQSRGSKQSMV